MINILFCGNDKIFDGLLTETLSILMRTTTKTPFCFYVFTMDITRVDPKYTPISDQQIDFLDKITKKYNPQNQVVKIDVGEIYDQEFARSPNEATQYSPYSYIRLLADLVPNMPDKLLYLDADLIFNRDITLLYEHDVTNYEFAAARDHYGKFIFEWNYINSGVLLFNMVKCRETGLFEKARSLLKTHKYLFPDQDALYKSVTAKLMLPQRFNDQRFLHKSTVVRHFSKRFYYFPYFALRNIKQWQIDKIHKVLHYHQFDDVLEEYKKYKDEFLQQTTK